MRYNLTLTPSTGGNEQSKREIMKRFEAKVTQDIGAMDFQTSFEELLKELIDGCTSVSVKVTDTLIEFVVETTELVMDIIEIIESKIKRTYHQYIRVQGGLA